MKYELYDFDGTIYDGDSGVDLVKFAIKKNPKFLLKAPKIIWAALKFALKIGTKEQAKNVIFSFLKSRLRTAFRCIRCLRFPAECVLPLCHYRFCLLCL